MIGMMNAGHDDPPIEFYGAARQSSLYAKKTAKDVRTYTAQGRVLINGHPEQDHTGDDFWKDLIMKAVTDSVCKYPEGASKSNAVDAFRRLSVRLRSSARSSTTSMQSLLSPLTEENKQESFEERLVDAPVQSSLATSRPLLTLSPNAPPSTPDRRATMRNKNVTMIRVATMDVGNDEPPPNQPAPAKPRRKLTRQTCIYPEEDDGLIQLLMEEREKLEQEELHREHSLNRGDSGFDNTDDMSDLIAEKLYKKMLQYLEED